MTNDHARLAARDAGAVAYALKSASPTELLEVIRRVAGGAVLLDAYETRVARTRLDQNDEGRIGDLTQQERRIFDLIGAGNSNRQIGNELNLAEKTVKNYVSNVLAKLGFTRRTQIAALAARLQERRTHWHI